jgi:hypothetical protein
LIYYEVYQIINYPIREVNKTLNYPIREINKTLNYPIREVNKTQTTYISCTTFNEPRWLFIFPGPIPKIGPPKIS